MGSLPVGTMSSRCFEREKKEMIRYSVPNLTLRRARLVPREYRVHFFPPFPGACVCARAPSAVLSGVDDLGSEPFPAKRLSVQPNTLPTTDTHSDILDLAVGLNFSSTSHRMPNPCVYDDS